MHRPTLLLLLPAFALAPLTSSAQGTLANQGFGYPFGQLSTRALSNGGAMVEFDPRSPWNPAALGATGRLIVLQYEPEYRRIEGAGVDESQRFIRFPLIAGVLPIGSRFALGFSTSTLLDRTGQSVEQRTEIIAGEPVTFDEIVRNDGAINDLRFGTAYGISDRLRVGLAAHAITGEYRQLLSRSFETPGFDSLGFESRASFSGLAFSGGVMWQVVPGINLGASGRLGQEIEAFVNDTARSTADVPDRVSVGLGVERISGVALAAHAAWEGWSSLDGLGSDQVHVHDSREYGLGAEVAGPTLFGATIPLRVGVRWRGLPFSADGDQVDETAIAGGIALPLLGGLSLLELGVQHARRSSALPFRERSLLVSFAMTIRP
jgi:hypothetical protein